MEHFNYTGDKTILHLILYLSYSNNHFANSELTDNKKTRDAEENIHNTRIFPFSY